MVFNRLIAEGRLWIRNIMANLDKQVWPSSHFYVTYNLVIYRVEHFHIFHFRFSVGANPVGKNFPIENSCMRGALDDSQVFDCENSAFCGIHGGFTRLKLKTMLNVTFHPAQILAKTENQFMHINFVFIAERICSQLLEEDYKARIDIDRHCEQMCRHRKSLNEPKSRMKCYHIEHDTRCGSTPTAITNHKIKNNDCSTLAN